MRTFWGSHASIDEDAFSQLGLRDGARRGEAPRTVEGCFPVHTPAIQHPIA